MKYVLKPAIMLFIFAAITTAALALVYRVTYEPIQEQHRRLQERTRQEVLPKAASFTEPVVLSDSTSIRSVTEGLDGQGETIGYVIEISTPRGYAGDIDLMVGISAAENIVTGMRILKHSETPGLGALAARERFYRLYDGRALAPIRLVVRTSAVEGEIEAITAATITTRAINDAVNEAITWYAGGGFR